MVVIWSACGQDIRLNSNREPIEPARYRYRQLVRMDVIHPIPVPFMDQHELRKAG